jgi:integrase
MATEKFDDRFIRSLPVPATGNKRTTDFGPGRVPRLNIVVTAAGARIWALRYRFHGKEEFYPFADFPDLNVKAARDKARQLRQQIRDGINPKAERDKARTAPTVADMVARYEAEHLPGKRPRSAAEDRSLIRAYILPALGRLKVADVTRADVERLHRRITADGKPVRANRVLACLRTIFTRAIGWEYRADNPARGGRDGVQMNSEDGRERFLSEAEIARLSEVLASHPERTTVALIRFLMLTGARFGEAAGAEWSQFNLAAGIWVKPSSHTKQKRRHALPLSPPAIALLSELQAEATGPYVFPSPKTGRPLVTIKTAWAKITRDADLKGVRIHDLRQSFASVLAGSGASLQLIGSLLGHTQISTTQKYAHLADDARRAAVERVGAVLTGSGPRQSAEVVEMPKSGRR